jgi:enoyl-CoA hydratase/carnithine racemase
MVEDGALLLTRAEALAQAMGNNPQQALRMVKALITQNVAAADLTQIQSRELDALQVCYDSPEHKEAIDAFIQKRSPNFKRARMEGGAE